MTATQLREEVLLELNPLFDSEEAMSQALMALRKIRLIYIHRTDQAPLNATTPNETSVSSRLQWLREHPVRLTDQELQDERTQYILSK